MQENSKSDLLVRVFEERWREAERAEDHAFKWFVANIIVLFALSVVIFAGVALGASFMIASWIEFVVALPLVYSAVFFHAQYAKARDYLEEYSFKLLTARALDAERAMLMDYADPKSAEERKKLLGFAVEVMKDLGVPPREIISKHPMRDEENIKVGTVEKLGDVFKKFISLR